MTTTAFSKWQGTGNDFIVIDDRDGAFPSNDLTFVRQLCDRHFGVGSDGLVLVQGAKDAAMDFHMEFFNPDGSRSFCGNGSRCAFAFWSGLTGATKALFTAIDGGHNAEWRADLVAISMNDVREVEHDPNEPNVDRIHTGSPHELVLVKDPEAIDIMVEGRTRRYASARGAGGTNVNFMHVANGVVHMRTYERGVEAETLSCGTGVVAAALSALQRGSANSPVQVVTRGGTLLVQADRAGEGFSNIHLIGPVGQVFNGTIAV